MSISDLYIYYCICKNAGYVLYRNAYQGQFTKIVVRDQYGKKCEKEKNTR